MKKKKNRKMKSKKEKENKKKAGRKKKERMPSDPPLRCAIQYRKRNRQITLSRTILAKSEMHQR